MALPDDLTVQQAVVLLARAMIDGTGTDGILLFKPEELVSGTFDLPDGAANAIGSDALTVGIVIKADEDNSADVYVGKSGVTIGDGMRLAPGESLPISVSSLAGLYVIGSTADKVHYIGG